MRRAAVGATSSTAAGKSRSASVDLPDELFGGELNVPRDAPGRDGSAGRGPLRAPTAPRPGPRSGWWREALAPEGHRPRPARFDPCARTGGAAAWPSARSPRDYRQKTPKKMVAAGAALGPGRPGRRGQGRRVRQLGLRRARRRRTPRRRSTALGSRARVLVVLAPRTTRLAWKSFRNLGRPGPARAAPSELNAYDVLVRRQGRLHPGRPCQADRRARRASPAERCRRSDRR